MSAWYEGAFPRFDTPVAMTGYQWWYVDALSDDGRYGLSLIAFVGNVFSPYYARARRRGRGDPEDHIALNVALYGPRKYWCQTERGRARLERSADRLVIGPSAVSCDGEHLDFAIDEWTMPLPTPVRGRVRVTLGSRTNHEVALDPAGRHRWSPYAPRSRVEVALERPRLAWSGEAYVDANRGDEPLEAAFSYWTWSRAHAPARADRGAETLLLYDVQPLAGERTCHALRVAADGTVTPFAAPPVRALPPGPIWRARRETRADGEARVVKTFEDAPFYTRSTLATTLLGKELTAMHESLDLARFDQPWVHVLLPFRMPRLR